MRGGGGGRHERRLLHLARGGLLALLDLGGRFEYVDVDDDHGDERQVEGEQRGVDLILEVGAHLAHLVDAEASARLAPAEQRRYADQSARRPHDQYHEEHELGVALLRVHHGVQDDEVAVDADGAQVEYGGGAEEHVAHRPQVAQNGAQVPAMLVAQLHVEGERHGQHAHEEVRHGQTHDQVVVGVVARVQLAHDHHRQYDEHVAHQSGHNDRHEDERVEQVGHKCRLAVVLTPCHIRFVCSCSCCRIQVVVGGVVVVEHCQCNNAGGRSDLIVLLTIFDRVGAKHHSRHKDNNDSGD